MADRTDGTLDFSDFLSDEDLQEIASQVKASPKGKLQINVLYMLAGNGHYRGALGISEAAELINKELWKRKLVSEKEGIFAKLVYLPSLLSGIGARIVEWAARDLYESLSKMIFFQYSWNEASRDLASSSRLDGLSLLTRKIAEDIVLAKHLEGVVLCAHFIPADIFAKYPEYRNRLAVIPLDDVVYPSFVRKETEHYFVGSRRCREDVTRALSAYGIQSDEAERRVHVTGQPISPFAIKGAPWQEEDNSFWDGKREPKYLIAMGGAGAQLAQMEALLSSFTKFKGKRRPEIVFFVGHHKDAAIELEKLGLPEGIRLAKFESRLDAISSLHSEISKCDALITKPSELSFYPVPIYSLPPIGFHEEVNLATSIVERRGRSLESLWNLPLDPLEELEIFEEDLPRMQKRALLDNPNLAGAFRIVKEACKLAPSEQQQGDSKR